MEEKKIIELFEEVLNNITNNPPEDKNKGHVALMQDVLKLTVEAHNYEFHDFKNEKYGAPKFTLISALMEMVDSVKSGKYDN